MIRRYMTALRPGADHAGGGRRRGTLHPRLDRALRSGDLGIVVAADRDRPLDRRDPVRGDVGHGALAERPLPPPRPAHVPAGASSTSSGRHLLVAVGVFSILFVAKFPDVSRLFLLGLFGAQVVFTLTTRSALRLLFSWARQRGYNRRFVLIIGGGPAAQAFADLLESHRELGLRVIGHLVDEPGGPSARPSVADGGGHGPVPTDPGTGERHRRDPSRPRGRRGRDLPRRWSERARRTDHQAVRAGGQDRPDPGRDRPCRPPRPHRGVRRHPGGVAGARSRADAGPPGEAARRHRGRDRRLDRAEPRAPRRGPLAAHHRGSAGPVLADPRRAPWTPVPDLQVADHGSRCRGTLRRGGRAQ